MVILPQHLYSYYRARKAIMDLKFGGQEDKVWRNISGIYRTHGLLNHKVTCCRNIYSDKM